MLSTVRKIRGLTCRDIYFAREPVAPAMQEDLQLFLQAAQAAYGSQPFVTSIVNLNQDENSLSGAFKKSTAYDVRRANDKDNASVEAVDNPTVEQIQAFCDFFDAFAVAKGIGTSNRRKLLLLSYGEALTLSFVRCDQFGDVWLAAHAYIVGENRARLLYSASKSNMQTPDERQIIGRANKYMHWKMLLHFKSMGTSIYDFGGISKCEALRSIDEFKESFGGKEVVEYNCIKAVSLKGRAAVLLLKAAQNFRKLLKPISRRS
jgi:lipid II:glycine glycyltransferase (peptidoglycan interpeptide bridge formation enzyme)